MPKPVTTTASIPMRTVGPIKIIGPEVNDEVNVPLATYETPLWYTTHRGARVSMLAGGIQAIIIDESMSRSFIVQGNNALTLSQITQELTQQKTVLQKIVSDTSRFAQLKNWHTQQVGNLLYFRLEITTGDASGHNMVTKAADALLQWLLERYPTLRYVSISGNYCTDKKVSAVNSILGRGKKVIAEITIPKSICQGRLRTDPQHIVELNIKKNLLGSTLAGSLHSSNAHFANILLALYLATGQDAANIVEGSQGITYAELKGEDLYFSVTLPNIIVGTVGNGKNLDFAKENLRMMGCLVPREPGQNARRLAIIIAAATLCGELSLLAALTHPGELMKSHIKLERKSFEAGKLIK